VGQNCSAVEVIFQYLAVQNLHIRSMPVSALRDAERECSANEAYTMSTLFRYDVMTTLLETDVFSAVLTRMSES
jgi:hypothetical protein